MTTPGEPNTASPHVSNDNEEFPNELHTLVVVSTPLPGGTSEKAWKRFNFQFCKWWNSDGVTGLQITTEVLATSLIPGEESIAIAGSSYGRAFMRRLLRSFEENSVKVANKGGDIAVVVGLVENAKTSTSIWSSTSKLSSVKNAFGHWKKHAVEFPEFINAKQYVEGAKNFLNNSPAGTLMKTRANGDILKYHPGTNTFGVMDATGVPRTMFRPTDGMKYWLGQ